MVIIKIVRWDKGTIKVLHFWEHSTCYNVSAKQFLSTKLSKYNIMLPIVKRFLLTVLKNTGKLPRVIV